jgi:hypothetical protein
MKWVYGYLFVVFPLALFFWLAIRASGPPGDDELRLCCCGEMFLANGSVEVEGIQHRLNGPCFHNE